MKNIYKCLREMIHSFSLSIPLPPKIKWTTHYTFIAMLTIVNNYYYWLIIRQAQLFQTKLLTFSFSLILQSKNTKIYFEHHPSVSWFLFAVLSSMSFIVWWNESYKNIQRLWIWKKIISLLFFTLFRLISQCMIEVF